MPPEWRYAPETESGRDPRLDLLRGVCLFKMVWNHFWRTPLHVVHQWTGFVSAAEGFFLISGVVVGLVHTRRVETQGWRTSARQLWRRAAELYAANLGLVAVLASLEAAGWLPERYIVGRLWQEGWGALLSFEHPYYLQVLPRYSVFLALTPLVLWLLRRRGAAWVLLGSVVLWAGNLASGGRLALPGLEAGAARGFPSASWQLIFFVGVILGAATSRGKRLELSPKVVAAAAASWLVLVWWHAELLAGAATVSAWLADRPLVAPLRVVNLLAAAVVCWWAVDRCWRPINRGVGALLMPFGRLALSAYLLHVVFAWVGLAVLSRAGVPVHQAGWRIVPLVAAAVAGLWWLLRRDALGGWVPR